MRSFRGAIAPTCGAFPLRGQVLSSSTAGVVALADRVCGRVVTPLLAVLLAACAAAPQAPVPPAKGSNPAQGAGTPPAVAAPVTVPSTGGPAAALPPPPSAPPLGQFSRIRVPGAQDPVLKLHAVGAQVFRCDPRSDGSFAWVFRQPDAELRDDHGQPAGRHGVNFSFEHKDGSRLIGEVKAWDSAPHTDALPWLLIATQSFGDGALKGVDYVQRVDTTGGMPPQRCDASQNGQVLRADFTADFVFYRPR